jgi:hypothetical protein
MNTLLIEKQTGGYFKFTLNGDTANAITSIQNDLLAVGNQLHFKTGNGANIIKEQFIYPEDVTVIAGGTFTFTTVAQVWDKLIEIDYFAWLGGGGDGVDRFDDLLDTFQYNGNAGKAVVVDNSELKLIPITLYNKRLFTELEDTPSELVPNKMVVVNEEGSRLILQDQPEPPEQFLNSVGYFDYEDFQTSVTPISFSNGVAKKLTNDTEGFNTSTDQSPYGVSYVWDSTVNQFNFTELTVGDTIDVRIHIKITTTTSNQKVDIRAKFGIGTASQFENVIYSGQFKSSGLHEISFVAPFYLGSEDVINSPAELYLVTDANASVVVLGWYVRILRKNINIITVDYEVPDATTTRKGILRLGGDLSGTANNPTVPELINKVPKSRTITINEITYDLTENRSWNISAGVWGQITGNLPDQTDLQNALNGKQNLLNGNGFVRMAGTNLSYLTGDSNQYVMADGTLSTAINSRSEQTFVATDGQTTFNMTYNVGQVEVFYNGSKLFPNEFTANNGTSIILATPATLNANISIVKYVTAINGISGTTNYISKFTSVNSMTDSQIFDNGTSVLIGGLTNVGDIKFQVNGTARVSGVLTLNSTISDGTSVYTLPSSTGTLALTSQLHNAVTLGAANGLSLSGQVLSLGLASGSATGALSSSDWTVFNNKQNVLSGSGIVKSTSGVISYLTDNTANWDTAYNDKINSASVTGTTTKTLTLTQQDGGTITASWTDINTDAVTSVFGRTGAVVAANGDYTTTQVTEGTNLYYTEARVSANTNVSANTAARHAAVTLGTANGLSLSGQSLSLGLSSASNTGALSYTDWTIFNNKQNSLSGVGFVKISGSTISYDNNSYVPTSRTITINGNTQNLNGDVSFTVSGVNGTTNYIPKFTSSTGIGNSQLFDNGNNIGIATIPQWSLSNNISLEIGSSQLLWSPTNGATNCGMANNLYRNSTNWIHKNTGAGGLIAMESGEVAIYLSTSSSAGSSADIGEKFRIFQNANVRIQSLGTGTVFSNSGTLTNVNPSDIRLKNDIIDLEYGLNEILQLRPVSYNWKNDKINQGKQFGFIAQEVQEIMPKLISEFTTTEDEEEVIRLGLDKEGIYATLVNAIQEQQKIIQSLTNRLSILENK